MKNLAIPGAALVLLSTMAFTGVQAAPTFASSDSRISPGYTQVDCMVRDGGPSGCWNDGPYSPDTAFFGPGQGNQHAASNQVKGYRGDFYNSGNARAEATAKYNRIGH